MNWKFLQRWHRRLGITVVLIVLLLVVTGILLNHTTELELDQRFVSAGWMLNWYEVKPQHPPISYRADDITISQVGERIYFNVTEIYSGVQSLHGAVAVDGMIILGHDDRLLLLNGQGTIIEQLDGMDGVPSGMRRIGLDRGKIVIRAAHGDYRLDLDRIHWNEEDGLDAAWSEPVEMEADLTAALLDQYRGRGLTLERVLLDLHSGRSLGHWGVWLFDLAAALLFLLGVSGIWMWFHRY
ncbi:MAG: PepSY domain-containing protein [Thiotrichales bacterium]|nr:PepSY domain-containing protein [Thiotrichales bacterium]